MAKYKLAAEDELRKHKDLDHVVLRPAIVYGLGEWDSTAHGKEEGCLPYLSGACEYIWALSGTNRKVT